MDLGFLITSLLYLAFGLGIALVGKLGIQFLNYLIDKNETVSWSDKEVTELSTKYYKLKGRIDALETKNSD